MYLILFVLHDIDKLQTVLDAWTDAGVSGITILPSTGLSRLRKSLALRDDLPLIPSLEDLMEHDERFNRTFFTIVEDEIMADKVIQVTENITGDLNKPNTGILAVLPVLKVFGLNREKEG